jgi:hypothetical protein
MVRDGIWRQEYVPHFVAWLFNLDTDYSLRFISALAGTLSIPAIYFVLKDYKWVGVFLIAFNPLFIFWSQLIRPYSIAGLFMILGWKYKEFIIPAILTTPISLIGFRFKRQQKLWMLIIIGITAVLYFIRPDYNRSGFTNPTIVFHSSRWYYLPAISIILYLCTYGLPYLKKKFKQLDGFILAGGFALSLFFLSGIASILNNETFEKDGVHTQWYRYECKFSDWRGIGKVDFATEVHPAEWYSEQDGTYVEYFQIYSKRKIDSLLTAGDTLTVGLGQIAINTCRQFVLAYLGEDVYKRYGRELYTGKVVKLDLWKDGKYLYHKYLDLL